MPNIRSSPWIFTRVFQHVFATLGYWAQVASSLVSRLLLPATSSICDIEQADHIKLQPSSVPPPFLEYIPVYGEWERKHFPNWPDDKFKIPATKEHNGQVYYIRKGDFIGMGTTALVERLPSGDAVVKTPLRNPLNVIEERMNREGMVREAEVYRRLSDCADQNSTPVFPKLLGWEAQSCTLTLEYQCNGDLATYIQENDATGVQDLDSRTREKWAIQATRALVTLHDNQVIHADIAPRNFLLNNSLDLCICDFAGSVFPGSSASTSAPGSKYQARSWGLGYVPTEADDIFSLGSVLYFIMKNEEPYGHLDDAEVQRRFQAHEFPDTDSLRYGSVIDNCWNGRHATARAVLEALNNYDTK